MLFRSIGTKLANVFSQSNQQQDIRIAQEREDDKKPYFLLRCAWIQGLQTFTSMLEHSSDHKHGTLARDTDSPTKESAKIKGLAENLIFCLAISDRDSVGKEGQNKGHVDNTYIGFDYGKSYGKEDGIASLAKGFNELHDDFSFKEIGRASCRERV